MKNITHKIHLNKTAGFKATAFPIINTDYLPYLLSLIDNAKESIEILMFAGKYYRGARNNPVNTFWHALARASVRNVQVRLLLNANFYMGGSLKDNQFIAQRFKSQNFQTAFSGKSTRLHSKLFIIDKKIIVLGSHNQSQRAFRSNFETSLAVDSQDLALSYLSHFERLWKSRQPNLGE